jgi:hypothetical protein
MNIAPDSLLVGFLNPKTFNLRSMPPTLSFCAQPQGEVAESIIQRITLALRERRDDRRRWVRALEDHFPPPLIRPDGHLLSREKGFLRFLLQWILQLRAGMPFVQNDMLDAMGTDSQVSVTGWKFYE